MKPPKILLEPWQRQVLYLATALLWLSGAFWLYLSMDDPSRPLWMKIHGAAAMVFLMLFGMMFVRHVPSGWQQKPQRPSGVSIITVCGVLILTGWGLYYLGADDLRHWTSLLHWGLGLLFPAILALHIWLGRRP